MTPAIETVDLTRGFTSGLAVDGVTFSIERGEVLALLGPNGAGKTTTVRLLNGVLRPDRGCARVLGFDPARDGEEVRRRTGVLTENAGLDDRLTTRENLELTARIRGFDRISARRRVDELLEQFGMSERADDLTQGFSTGQRKRVALARALLHDPEVLFLDEPTSGLDPAGTRDVINLIQELAGEGRTIILATHFLGEAGRLAHRMAVLHNGRLRAFGSPRELATGIWQDMAAEIDLGGPASDQILGMLRATEGVVQATASPTGADLRVTGREGLARAVATLVGHEVHVFGAVAHPPTLEDVYFEIERRILAETGDRSHSDGFAHRWLQTGSDPR
ncbi:MAG: ABC transporter ATP-binding protein [Acidimicrobiales bacterium]